MKRQLRVSRRATRQIEAAASWWRENRPLHPMLFESEFRQALSRIKMFPDVFAPLDEPRLPGLRRLLLSQSRYHVYWTTSDDAIEIIAVWHLSRGTGPLDDE